MPSPKAVLRDIHDLKLDPKVRHTGHGHGGRLPLVGTKSVAVHHVVKHIEPVVTPEPVVELPDFPEVKPGVHPVVEQVQEVKAVEEPVVELKPEPVVEEIKAPEEKGEAKPEPKQEPEQKPAKKAKKDEKKSEEPKVS